MLDNRNYEWVETILVDYHDRLSELYDAGEPFQPDRYSRALAKANELNTIAWPIVVDLLLDVAQYDHNLGYSEQVTARRNDVQRAIRAVRMRQELEYNLPSEPAAKLDTSQLHPWVWEPAKELWAIGRCSLGLQTAALAVNARMQKKIGRTDIEFGSLSQQAFTESPPEQGKNRLRILQHRNMDDDTRRNCQFAARALGECIFRRWRNIPTHNEPSEEDARERTAAFHTRLGRDVIRGDALDRDHWERLRFREEVELVLIATDNHTSNLACVARAKEYLPAAQIGVTARYPDQVIELYDAGVGVARNLYQEAGQGLANDAVATAWGPESDVKDDDHSGS